MRCYSFPGGTPFTEHHLSADSHHELRRACGHEPQRCDCTRAPKECPRHAVRIDDAFAIVPRPLAQTYFRQHAGSFFEGLSSTTHDFCPQWAECARLPRRVKGCHSSPECRLTHSLLTLAHAHVVPTALHFAIARTRGRKWGAGARLGPLFLSSPLASGAMDRHANVTYRCASSRNRGARLS